MMLSTVVPAKAGTHTLFPLDFEKRVVLIASIEAMGPRLRGDDSGSGMVP